jgi:hypothetical protein
MSQEPKGSLHTKTKMLEFMDQILIEETAVGPVCLPQQSNPSENASEAFQDTR